jgi:hypothetical protein
MHVVEDEHGGRAGGRKLAHEARSHGVRLGIGLDGGQELATDGFGHVEERPERSRREEGVTGSPQRPDLRAVELDEPAEQDGLADPRLALDEYETAAGRLGFGEGLHQDLERRLALEELVERRCG